MAILVSVMGEISSGAIDLAEKNLEMLIRISLISIKAPENTEDSFYKELVELQKGTVDEILKELIRQVNTLHNFVSLCLFFVKIQFKINLKLSIPLNHYNGRASISNNTFFLIRYSD